MFIVNILTDGQAALLGAVLQSRAMALLSKYYTEPKTLTLRPSSRKNHQQTHPCMIKQMTLEVYLHRFFTPMQCLKMYTQRQTYKLLILLLHPFNGLFSRTT